MASTYVSDARTKFIDYALIAICLAGVFIMFEIRNFAYFRDYSITFEGAYRIFLGQVPYRDFGTPVGPGSFAIPAVFFKLFEPNWTVFLISQQFQNACLLIAIYYILNRIYIKPVVKRVSLILFSIFYILLLSHPWYNSTATLLMFGSAFYALGLTRVNIFFSGILAALCLLTKQDFGFFAFAISFLFIVLRSLDSDWIEILPNLDIFSNNRWLPKLLINLLLFIGTVIAIITIFVEMTSREGFLYWFNYGQEPHIIRPLSFYSLLYGALGWAVMYIALNYNNFRLFSASLFTVVASITNSISGLGFTHFYYIAFLPVIIDETLSLNTRHKKLVVFLVLMLTTVLILKPLRNVYLIFESIKLQKPEHFFFDYRKISRPLASFPDNLLAFSQHTQAPSQTIELIQQLKSIADGRHIFTTKKDLSVLNLTELTPIYAEMGVEPPKELPLWFHTNISLFPREIKKIDNMLANGEFDIILLQGTHEGLTATYKNFISILNANRSYVLVRTVNDSPANATWPCEPNCQGEIYVYMKHSLKIVQ